jgi:hypothetical protein
MRGIWFAIALLGLSRVCLADDGVVRLACHFDSPEGPKELTLAVDTVHKTVDSTPPAPVKVEDSLFSWSAGNMVFAINRYTGKFTFGPPGQPELMVGRCEKAAQQF